MNLTTISTVVALTLSITIVTGCIGMALTEDANSLAPPPEDPIPDTTTELSIEELVTDYIIDNDLASDDVSRDDILLVVQLAFDAAEEFDDVTPGMLLAVIGNESSFHYYSTSKANARGLMQLIPRWHKSRLQKYMGEGKKYSDDLFYNSYLNIMTGADYLQQIIGQMKNEYNDDDLRKVFMWYNQGAVSASTNWNKGIYSGWSKIVKEDMEDIDNFIASTIR